MERFLTKSWHKKWIAVWLSVSLLLTELIFTFDWNPLLLHIWEPAVMAMLMHYFMLKQLK